MRILIFSQYYFPEQFLINDIAPQLQNNGNTVTVITGIPNYPLGKVPDEYRNAKRRHEVIDGVEVIRCSKKIKILINYLSYMFFATIRSLPLRHYDVVYCYQLTPVMQAFPAILYKKFHHVKLLLYCLDLAPLSGEEAMSSTGIVHKCYYAFSKWVYQNCDSIGVTSESFADYLVDVNGINKKSIFSLPQHAPEMLLNKEVSSDDNDVFDFMFAGNIADGLHLETIIEAASILADRYKFMIHMVGDGLALAKIKNLVSEKNLNNYFIFYGRKKSSEMPKYYTLADALLITLRKGNSTLPGKLQMYMTTGKPIFGAMNGSGADVIREADCGVCVPAEDAVSLAAAMESFIIDPKRYANCGENARSYFKLHFTKQAHMEKLEGELKRLSDMQAEK